MPGRWSGLYGSTSTREGLKRLLSDADVPLSVFRVVCTVPGGIVTIMSAEESAALGYLNLRYADAQLMGRLEAVWSRLAHEDDPQKAIHTRPDLVVEVLAELTIDSLRVVLHPFRPANSKQVLTVGTILDPGAVEDIRSRNKDLDIRVD